jgi:hypothetical protein
LRNALQNKDLRVSAESPSALFQRAAQDALPAAEMPPDLAQIATRWHDLSKHIREAILSLAQLKGNS